MATRSTETRWPRWRARSTLGASNEGWTITNRPTIDADEITKLLQSCNPIDVHQALSVLDATRFVSHLLDSDRTRQATIDQLRLVAVTSDFVPVVEHLLPQLSQAERDHVLELVEADTEDNGSPIGSDA